MSNIGSYAEGLLLNFCLNTATATRPTVWGIGLSLGVPSSISGSEIGTASGYARQTGQFGTANAGSLINTLGVTFGPFSTQATISGIQVWDTVTTAANGGDLLWYGTLATAQTVQVGASLVLASGALTISLS